jgi:hypothetical protein
VNCYEVREAVAVALMTHARVEGDVLAHLSQCPDCSGEAAQMHEVVNLLSELGPTGARREAGDDVVLERLLSEAGRRRTAGRRRLAFASSVAAIVVLLAVTAAVVLTEPFRSVGDATASASQDGVTVSVTMEAEDAGSDLVVSVGGVELGTHCVLRVNSDGGPDEVVADWIVLYDGTSRVEAEAATPPDQLTSLQLVDATKDLVLVTVPLT